jgi:hypothetical protein
MPRDGLAPERRPTEQAAGAICCPRLCENTAALWHSPKVNDRGFARRIDFKRAFEDRPAEFRPHLA